ncbi:MULTISPECIES: LysR family transcriptional regulator [Roseobacteraceae]|uniref:LysR family transcriptional regulator n=1 Tax=Roseobacteraceae TaxID=2854170 RepID=UPI001C439E54|nr:MULTISPECIES: LysR family transcriptional regulator [Roseobacteraceae]MBV7408861.1 LysR family transcriptional regulator [Maritimibacter sp. DP1N21-5]MBY5934452.1 LysR family transcriptional regulator [Tateyamaria omphalii]
MTQPDWSQIQSFAAVAEHGSLSAAARAQGSSQPTLSRHIAQLEATLGTRLFDRSRGGMILTDEGTDLLAHATAMADAAARFDTTRDGHGTDIAGTVRLTASHVVANFILPPILSDLHTTYPGIEIEVVASDTTENLLRREADIALRMYRPTQPDVIARHITDLPLGAYAAPAYIERHGAPDTLQDLHHHSLVGYDRSTLIIEAFAQRGLKVGRDFFAFRSDDQVLCWHMVIAGYGIGFAPRRVGDADSRVIRVSRDEDAGTMPLWLTAHPDVRRIPRVRRVYDWLARHLA